MMEMRLRGLKWLLPKVTKLILIATVYYNYLQGILDMLKLISQQYHKLDAYHYSQFLEGET